MVAAGLTKLHIALILEKKAQFLELGYSEQDCAGLSYNGEIEAIFETLEALGHRVTQVPGIRSLVRHLAEHQGSGWNLAFHMAEGFFETARVAGSLSSRGMPDSVHVCRCSDIGPVLEQGADQEFWDEARRAVVGVLEYLWNKERPLKGAPFAGALSFAQGFVLESTETTGDQDPVV
ncbi:D-alanine--D-alanine ligase [Ophiocordyceps sinensis CO18]|nr:D-alanine--D-alanine ligase [Ophiocordyceps sinensis CO18]